MKNEKVNIHKNHRKRMREKFDEIGFNGWSRYEILEYMLYNVYLQQDTNPIAHNIMDYNMNSFVRMFENSKDFRMAEDVDGVGEKTVLFLRSLKAFLDYYRAEELKERPVQLTRDNFMDVIHTVNISTENEEIIMVCLDKFLRVKSVVRLTEYSDEGFAVARIDKIARVATQSGAKSVVLVHTHPSGCPDVSIDDVHMTAEVDKLLSALHVSLIDHFIISGDKLVSIKVVVDEEKKKKAQK